MKDKIVFIVGATACGKTEIAVELAASSNGEILSCDSMQAYKGMDLGTAKPSPQAKSRVAHHLIDILEPSEEYSAADFRERALGIIKRLLADGRLPIVAGGSGLYVKALIDGLFPAPKADWPLRRRFYYEARKNGSASLYERLKEADSQTASRLHPNDLRRVIRALEIYELTGSPPSKLKEETKGIESDYDIRMFGISRRRSDIYARIDRRVDEMLANGFVDEVRRLASEGMSRTASAALGYKEIMGYIKGEYGLEEAERLIKRNTRRFAKRQLTWFKADTRIKWVDVKEGEDLKEAAKKIKVLMYV